MRQGQKSHIEGFPASCVLPPVNPVDPLGRCAGSSRPLCLRFSSFLLFFTERSLERTTEAAAASPAFVYLSSKDTSLQVFLIPNPGTQSYRFVKLSTEFFWLNLKAVNAV